MNPWIEVDGGVTPSNAYKVIFHKSICKQVFESKLMGNVI